MKLKQTIALVAACALVGTLGACSSASGDGGKSDGIVWDMWAGSEDDVKALDGQLAIAKKATGLDVKLQTAPWNDYFTKLTTNLSSGNMACVTSMNGQRLSGYYTAFEPLTEEMLAKAGIKLDDFAPGATDILTYDGKLYGLPYDVSAMMVYYNKDMLKAAGAPEPTLDWTFDDFEKIAKAATTDKAKGFAVALGEFQWMALPIAKSGVQPVDQSGKLDLANPKFVEASTWYGDLVTKQKVADPVASASDTGWGENQYTGQNAAMAVDGTWNATGYFTNDAGFKAGATRMPKGENGSTGVVLGSGYGIAKSCKNKDAALKVLGALVSKEAQDVIASTGRSYPARAESQPLYFESVDASYRDELKAAFEAAFADTEGQRTTTTWAQVNQATQPELVSVYNGDKPMADMLKSAQQQFGQ